MISYITVEMAGINGLKTELGLKTKLEGNKLVVTGVASKKPFNVTITVDIISIDGELYAVPRTFTVYEPLSIKDIDEVALDVKPSVEYVRLASGLYVPKGYVSEEVMKKLEELDTDYAAYKMVHDLEGMNGYENYEEFENFFLRHWEISEEQAETLIKELQKNGFKIEYRNLVKITGPDGDVGYYILSNPNRYMSFSGKWSLVGFAVNVAWDHDFEKALKLIEDRPGRSSFRDYAIECEAELLDDGTFDCDGYKAIPIRPVSILPNHRYTVKCIKVRKKLCVAVSYKPIHKTPIRSVVSQTFGLVSRDRVKMIDYRVYRCENCSFAYELVSTIEHAIDVISVDGKLKAVFRDSRVGMLDIDEMYHVPSDLRPSVEYITLPSGLYVPKDYVSEDVLRELQKITDVKEQAKVLIGELKKRGFRFEHEESGYPIETHFVIVYGPDGDKGEFFMIPSSMEFEGKWSPLGVAVAIVFRQNKYSLRRY